MLAGSAVEQAAPPPVVTTSTVERALPEVIEAVAGLATDHPSPGR